MAFAHLHVHTEYSLLDGSNKIKEYVARVKELGMNSAAITDHGVMYGVIDFYRAAREAGIKPILGCEAVSYTHLRENFDLRPAGIIKMLDLRRPIYKQTASYGHFGRTDVDLPWEKLDKVDLLKKYL